MKIYLVKLKNLFKDSTFKRLYKHTLNYGFGDVLAQIIGFFLIPIYTRYLTPEDYGIIEMTTSITAFCVPLMKLGLPGSITRHYFDYQDDSALLRQYITTVDRLLTFSAIIIGGLLLTFLYFFGDSLFEGLEFVPFVLLSVITAGLGAKNQVQQRIIQNREQSRYSVILKTIFSLSSVAMAVAFVVYLKMGAFGMVLSQFIITIAFFIQALFYLKSYVGARFNISMAKEALTYGMGVLPHHLAAAAAPFISKTLLMNMGSLLALGIYSMALRFFLPLELLFNATNTAFIPIYNGHRKAGESEKIKKTVRQILIMSFIAFTFFQMLGPWLMIRMLPDRFYNSITLMPILSIAFIGKTIYGICVAEIFYSKKTRFVSFITIGGLIINFLISFLLLNKFGAVAVAWAFSCSFLFWAILAFFYKIRISSFYSFSKEFGIYLFASLIVAMLAFYYA